MPSALATTRQRQAEHTVVRAVITTAAATAGQVTARSPSLNGAAPTCRQRNHSTVTAAARRRNNSPNRRTAGPIPAGAGTECWGATPGYTDRPGTSFNRPAGTGRGPAPPYTMNQHDRGPVVPTGTAADSYADGGAVRAIRPADEAAGEVIRPADRGGLPVI